MSNEYLEQLKSLSKEERSDNIGQIATVLAIKEVTDVLERVVRTQDRQDKKLDEMGNTLHSIDKRVTRVEDTEIKPEVEKNTLRIAMLEKDLFAWKVRVYTITGVLLAVWAIFGDAAQHWIGLVNV